MSNQIGDRYTCSDPNCGCEVVIESPCGLLTSSSKGMREADELEESDIDEPIRQEFPSENIATPGFTSQGATAEGFFGTVGGSDRSATASGRYDTEGTVLRESSSRAPATLRCFCGHEMRQRSQAAKR
jgi:hypothetical protein